MPPEPPLPLSYATPEFRVTAWSHVATAVAALVFSWIFLMVFAFFSGVAISDGPANPWLDALEGVLFLLALLLIAFLLYRIEMRRLHKRATRRNASFRQT